MEPLRQIWTQIRSLRYRLSYLINKINAIQPAESMDWNRINADWTQYQRAKEDLLRTLHNILRIVNYVIELERRTSCRK